MTFENVIFVIQQAITSIIAVNPLSFASVTVGNYFSDFSLLPSLIFQIKLAAIQFMWLNIQENLKKLLQLFYL